jgi:hypothetical protein
MRLKLYEWLMYMISELKLAGSRINDLMILRPALLDNVRDVVLL